MSGLFLLNPPMKIRLSASLFRNAIKVATGQTENDPVAQAAKEAYGISLDFNPFHYYGWPKRYSKLFTATRRVKESVLPQIRTMSLKPSAGTFYHYLTPFDKLFGPFTCQIHRLLLNSHIHNFFCFAGFHTFQ